MNTLKKIFLTTALVATGIVSAQVKIGDNVTSINASSALEIESSNKGLLFPRVALTSTTSFAPLSAHVAGMTVYNTATMGDVTPGMYTDNGSAWVRLGATATSCSVVLNTATTYTILGTEDIILNNTGTSAATFTLPATATIGKRIVIANKAGNQMVSIVVASGGAFWNGFGFGTSGGNSNVFTYTGTNGWINESIGLN